MSVASNFEEILTLFKKHTVSFMLAGGYAVNFHGYNRSTGDLDIWVQPVEENKKKIIAALQDAGFSSLGIEQINKLDFIQPFSFKIGLEPIDIDVFNHITGVKYEEADKNKISYAYSDNLTVHYISIRDLIVNKMLTGRPKDKVDVEYLQKIEQLKKP
jgi:hypothetical protein